jgi:KamA family protein
MLKYKSFTIKDLELIPQSRLLSARQIEEIKIVSEIYPFKTNNYVLDKLIDWTNVPDDPVFRLNFPHKGMLSDEHFDKIQWSRRVQRKDHSDLVKRIRRTLNPHPAGQTDLNIPYDETGHAIEGIQHKYRTTLLFFPSHSQTCHAYCTFCFRWPQFVNDPELKMQAKEITPLLQYLHNHPQVNDVLITGGDPMVMSPRVLSMYIDALLEVETVKTIRIGTKSLSYWPYKYVTDPDAEEILKIFRQIVASGRHLAFMAHFNHPAELRTEILQEAIHRVRQTGAEIRTQAPLLRNINNNISTWKALWTEQVRLGCVPYYMFLPRDTGAQHYFAESLQDALNIYRGAIQNICGVARTARGPVMSITSGKVELLDIEDGCYSIRYLQHRMPELTYKIFRAKARVPRPKWFDDLVWYDRCYEKYFDNGVEAAPGFDLMEQALYPPVFDLV